MRAVSLPKRESGPCAEPKEALVSKTFTMNNYAFTTFTVTFFRNFPKIRGIIPAGILALRMMYLTTEIIPGRNFRRLFFRPAALLAVLLPLISLPVCGQLEKVERVEFPVSTSLDESFEVFPLGDQGALTILRKGVFSGRGEEWHLSRLDTNLRAAWASSYQLNFRYVPVMAYQNQLYAYWVFAEPDTDKFLFLQVNLETGDRDVHEGKLLSNIDIHHFKVMESKAILAGYHRGRPVVVVYSFFDRTTRVLPGLYEKNSELNGIDLNEHDGLINVITYAFRKRQCLFQIKTYNYEGRHLKTTTLTDEDYSIISGQIIPLNENDSYLIGNYSIGCTPFSQGIYISHIMDTEPEKLEYIEFSELENFFNYMSPKRKARMIARIGKRKSLGKENKFRYRLLLHNLIETETEILLVAEVYYPNYRNYNPGGVGMNSFSRGTIRAQDGYRYTHAIVCGFDKDGKYKWDNSFAIKNLVSYDLQEMVQLSRFGDYWVLAYPDEGNIHTEVIKREKVIVESTKHELQPKSRGLLYHENANLAAWYDRYFIAFGRQKPEDAPTASQKEVYYITKLTYQVDPVTGVPLSDTSVNSKTSAPKKSTGSATN